MSGPPAPSVPQSTVLTSSTSHVLVSTFFTNLGAGHSETGRWGFFPNELNPVASWREMAAPRNGNSQVFAAQRWRQAITEPGAVDHRSLRAKTVLDSGANISSIPESLCPFLKPKLPDDKIRSPMFEGPQYVRLANGQIVVVSKGQ